MAHPPECGEAPLQELISDPIVMMVMRSDGITWNALMGAIYAARARLSYAQLQDEDEMHE